MNKSSTKHATEKIVRNASPYHPENDILKEKKLKSRKVLAVFDGYKFSKSTLEYAIQFTRQANAFLVGVFLDDSIYRSYNLLSALKSGKHADKLIRELDAKDQEKRDATVRQFEKTCGKAGIHYTCHRNTGIAIQELKQESIFADLLVINNNETFNRVLDSPPTLFIKELLGGVQCPVIIVPGKYKPIDKITLLYDGKPSSVFAIKMFSYLFGELTDSPVQVFNVKDPMDGNHLPNNKLMREFIKRHFPGAEYIVQKGEAKLQILTHLRYQKGNELVVLGAYRRSEMSRWFKTSMADVLMKELNTPLFIAHNK